MNYDMNMIKYRKSGFFRIAAAILMICFTLFGLTACAGTTDSKDNNDDNALIQGTWEIDTGSGAGYKFVDDKFMWLKSIENVNDNYWYGDVEYYNGAEAMEIKKPIIAQWSCCRLLICSHRKTKKSKLFPAV